MNRVNAVDAFELTSMEWALVEFANSNLDAITRHISWLSKSHVMNWRDGKAPSEGEGVNFRYFQTEPRQLPLTEEILDRFGYIPIPSHDEARDVDNFCKFVDAKFGRTLSDKTLTYTGWSRKTGKRISAFDGNSSTFYRKRLRALLRDLEFEHERIHGLKRQMRRVEKSEAVEDFLNRIAVLENHLEWWRRTQNCKDFIASRAASPVHSGSTDGLFDFCEYQGEADVSSAIDRRMAEFKIREILPPKRGDLVLLEEIEDYARKALTGLQLGYDERFEPGQYFDIPKDEFNYKWYLRSLVDELEIVVASTTAVCNSWQSHQSQQALRALTLVEDFVDRLENSDPRNVNALPVEGLNAGLAEEKSRSIIERRFSKRGNSPAPSVAEMDDAFRFSTFVEEFSQALKHQEILRYSVYRMRAIPPKKWLNTTYGGKTALLARLPVFSLEGKQLVGSRDGLEFVNPISDGEIRDWIRDLYQRIDHVSSRIDLPYREVNIPSIPIVVVHVDVYSDEWLDEPRDPVWSSYMDWEFEVEGPDFLSDLGFDPL